MDVFGYPGIFPGYIQRRAVGTVRNAFCLAVTGEQVLRALGSDPECCGQRLHPLGLQSVLRCAAPLQAVVAADRQPDPCCHVLQAHPGGHAQPGQVWPVGGPGDKGERVDPQRSREQRNDAGLRPGLAALPKSDAVFVCDVNGCGERPLR